jgi:hypothetical protein
MAAITKSAKAELTTNTLPGNKFKKFLSKIYLKIIK